MHDDHAWNLDGTCAYNGCDADMRDDNVVAFIRARLDEDEQTALQDPHPEHSRPILSYIDYGEIEIGTARVLAQVAAMRAVLDAWPDTFGQWNAEQAEAARAVKDMIRRKLAAIWDWHPDYDPAWSPERE